MQHKLPSTLLISSLLAISLQHKLQAAPVNINMADATTIASSLSGIGRFKAQAIINYRHKHGSFKQAADIVKVKGIGFAAYRKNLSDILVK